MLLHRYNRMMYIKEVINRNRLKIMLFQVRKKLLQPPHQHQHQRRRDPLQRRQQQQKQPHSHQQQQSHQVIQQ